MRPRSLPRPRTEPDWLAEFLGLYFHDPAVGLLRAAEAELVAAERLPPPRLDIGCGDGSFAARALPDGRTIGIDRDLGRARRARRTGAYRAVVVADAHRLPFRDDTFASALANSTLEHIPGAGDVLRELARVLRFDGTLVFTLHNQRFGRQMFFWPRLFSWLGRPDWLERYRHARLRRLAMENLMGEEAWRSDLAEAGLHAVEVRGYLSGRADRAFEMLLVLGRFGLGRLHVGAILRLGDRALAATGLRLHRRLAGRALARLLGEAARDRSGEPAAILVRAVRADAAAAANVVPLARYRP